jgi:hypothetical protein
MKITIDFDGAAARRLARFGAYALVALAVAYPVYVTGSQVGTLVQFQPGGVIKAADFNANFQAIQTAVDDNDTRIGNLTQLTTTKKSDLVSAINEVRAGGGGTGIVVNSPLTGNGTTGSPLGFSGSFLPLSGGTLTGALGGTTAGFTAAGTPAGQTGATPGLTGTTSVQVQGGVGGTAQNALGGTGGTGASFTGGTGGASSANNGGLGGPGISVNGGSGGTGAGGSTNGTGGTAILAQGGAGLVAGVGAISNGGLGIQANGGDGFVSTSGGDGISAQGGTGGPTGQGGRGIFAKGGGGGIGNNGVEGHGGNGTAGGGFGGVGLKGVGGNSAAAFGGDGVDGTGGAGGGSAPGGSGGQLQGGPGGSTGHGGVGLYVNGGNGGGGGATNGGAALIATGGAGGGGGTGGDAANFVGNVSIAANGGVTGQPGNLVVTGNANVIGTLTKGGGAFKIDHPLDPDNKFLFHSFVESPDMKNVYDGIAVLDAKGEAVVEMPAWFEALNKDFRYQLTCVGGYAPVYVAEKVHANRFKIAGGSAGLEVSWQLTGIRKDAFAEAHRIQVEVEKSASERGRYVSPVELGKPASLKIGAAPEIARAPAATPQPR